MELVLRNPRGFIETINRLTHKKEENIYYEEEKIGGARISGDVKSDFIDMLQRIGADGKTLIITDPYLLTCRQPDDILNFLIELIQGVNPSEVIVVTPEKNTCPRSYEYVKEELAKSDIEFEHKPCNEFHDRFWVVIEGGGVVMGTSFNGMLGRHVFYLNMLSSEDVNIIIGFLKSERII